MKIDLTQKEIDALRWVLGGGFGINYTTRLHMQRTLEYSILAKLEHADKEIRIREMIRSVGIERR